MTALDVIKYIIDLGPAVFLPLVMFIIGLGLGLRPAKAFSAALTLGVAFSGIGLVIGFMFGAVGPAGQAFIERTGVSLTALDTGWTPAAAISWAWPYAVLMFPLQIAINLIMLAFGWTQTLNVDMWNVWHKAFYGALLLIMTGNLWVSFVVAAILVVMELKSADYTQRQVHKLTGIPGISVPHIMLLDIAYLAPINRLLDYIPGLDKVNVTPENLRARLGFLGENHVLGFIIGGLIALIGGKDVKTILATAITAGTALLLLPMVAKLFMQALAPVSEAATDFMKSRFKGKTFYIGLDWPVLAGNPTLWSAAIVLIPVIFGLALILPGNALLPFGSILLIEATIPVAVMVGGDLVRTIILGAVNAATKLYVATFFASAFTTLARDAGTAIPPEVQATSWLGLSSWGYVYHQFAAIFSGNFMGIIAVAVGVVLYWYYRGAMKKKEAELGQELAPATGD